jgi:nitrous oxidase accessory protein NosD
MAIGPGTTTLSVGAGELKEEIAVTVSRPSAPIRIRPGDDIQTAVNAAPDGATFLLLAGVHRGSSITPRDGMTFVGEAGAVLDGDLMSAFAFRADSGNNVTLRGLTIRRYASPLQEGAVRAEGASGWVVDSCDISDNATGGIRLGNRMRITRSRIHDNGQIGLLGSGDNIRVEGNEISFNNRNAGYDMYWEAGGTKFARTRDLIVRDNFVHHNHGPGLWTDIDNVRTLFEGNRVEDNAEAGILHEISYSAVIRHNTLRRNGGNAIPRDAHTGAGILVSASSDVEIYGNTVEDNHNGIIGIQAARETGAYGSHVLRNLYVHDNLVRMREGAAGIVTRGFSKIFDRATYSRLENQFRRNTYRLGSGSRYFEWRHRARTTEQWRAFGQDSAGRFVP